MQGELFKIRMREGFISSIQLERDFFEKMDLYRICSLCFDDILMNDNFDLETPPLINCVRTNVELDPSQYSH